MVHACSEEVALRIKTYINMVEDALNQSSSQADKGEVSKEVKSLIALASDYLRDAKYYMSVGDCITSLACISYSEGLLDALARLGKLSIKWRRVKPAKVFVGGTFDLLHPGHVRFLKEASTLGLVYAVVARDENVYKVKGRYPVLSEEERLEVVSSLKYVYKAMLGNKDDILKPVIKLRPDVIFLGPDQSIDESILKENLAKRGLNVKVLRMKNRVAGEHLSSSGIIKEVLRKYCNTK